MSSAANDAQNGEAGPSSPIPIRGKEQQPGGSGSPTTTAQAVSLPASPPSQPGGSSGAGTLAAAAHILSPKAGSMLSDAGGGPGGGSPRSSLDHAEDRTERHAQLEQELNNVRQERDVLAGQYRGLLGKLTAMRQTLGEKLKSDAEELDRRETSINTLTAENAQLQETITTLQGELASVSQEATSLQAQLAQLRSQSDSSSSDVLSLTREMRELRGEMERLRDERETWEREAGVERQRRETAEDEMRTLERREREARREAERWRDEGESEQQRARNLQDVLAEFQSSKDSELRQATEELESQLRIAATSLSEYKLRAANAETRLAEIGSDASKSAKIEKELRDKDRLISKLRHDAVVNNEHLTEALRRLRKNSSDTNVDRRLVTNVLLSFLTTARGDNKRFEMLSLLSTILSWDDREREKAGLQRDVKKGAGGSATGTGKPRTGSNAGAVANAGGRHGQQPEGRSAEEEAAMNESFSNLFVEFLLKEASQGQPAHSPTDNVSPAAMSPLRTPSYTQQGFFSSSSVAGSSPPRTGQSTPLGGLGSPVGSALNLPHSFGMQRKSSGQGLQNALDGRDTSR